MWEQPPKISPANFPYRRKWTTEELDDVYARYEKLSKAMRDPVGISGQALFIPPEQVAILALHLSLAGGDMHDDDRQFIWPYELPDEAGMWEGRVEWKVKKDTPPPPKTDDAERQADQLLGQIERTFPPEVREAMKQKMVEQYRLATEQPETEQET